MIKGLYAAASAMLAGLTRQNMITHNLANVDTPGFREILLSLDDFMNTNVSSRPDFNATQQPISLGQLGLGVQTSPEITDYQQGALQQTGELLDFAVQGDGFFHVRTPAGDRYTRDGRFTRDTAGNLVTVDGYFVLDNNGQPLTVPEGQIAASGDGTLFNDAGQVVGQLGLASFANPQTELTRDGAQGNLFIAAGAPTGTTTGTVAQGYLEAANINPAQLMTQMVAVNRAYEAAQRMVQVQDELLGRAISTISRL
jgi:flagellar basal-body rod protein FlgF